ARAATRDRAAGPSTRRPCPASSRARPAAPRAARRRARRTAPCSSTTACERISCEQPRHVAIPVALKNLLAVERAFGREEIAHRRMRGLDLRARRETVIGQEVAAVAAQR